MHTQADSPNPEKLPAEDVVGVTIVLLTCSFRSNEFVRVGYYVNNEYADPELAENAPTKPAFDKVYNITFFFSFPFWCYLSPAFPLCSYREISWPAIQGSQSSR